MDSTAGHRSITVMVGGINGICDYITENRTASLLETRGTTTLGYHLGHMIGLTFYRDITQ